ncbi:hypothetical protein D3C72_1538830 [compost metagenome]
MKRSVASFAAARRRRCPNWAIRFMWKSTGCARTAGTSTGSCTATQPPPLPAPAPRRRPTRWPHACALPLPPASAGNRATTPRTGRCGRKTWIWWCSWAITSTRPRCPPTRARSCRARTACPPRPACRTSATATRCTRATRCCRPCMPRAPGWSPGTTMKSRTTTRDARAASPRQRFSPGARPATRRSMKTCRSARARWCTAWRALARRMR